MARNMKYLKLFESFDDSDTMARYQLFEADTTMAFDFNREFITDVEYIKDLIEKYNEYYVKGKSWSGGPPPREFIEYFNKNYSQKGNASMSSWYPTIDLMIKTQNYGTLIVGFSIINKSYKLFNWGSLTKSGNSSECYDKKVLSEIGEFVREVISKMTIDEVIDYFQLNIENKVDWNWKLFESNDIQYDMDWKRPGNPVREKLEIDLREILLEIKDLGYRPQLSGFIKGFSDPITKK